MRLNKDLMTIELSKRKINNYFVYSMVVFFTCCTLSSCSSFSRVLEKILPKKHDFTFNSLDKLNEDGFDLSGVLFYPDIEIVLNRLDNDARIKEKNNRGVYVESGKVEFKNLKFNHKTSGMISKINPDVIDIKFEENPQSVLSFYYNEDISQNYIFAPDSGIVIYRGLKWKVTSGNGANLTYKVTNRSRSSLKNEKIRGIKSNGNNKFDLN